MKRALRAPCWSPDGRTVVYEKAEFTPRAFGQPLYSWDAGWDCRYTDVFPKLSRDGKLAYAGGYDAVRRYARGWKRERVAVTAAAHVPLRFDPGEAYQFDWSHEIVLIGGTTVTIKVAHVRLCHTLARYGGGATLTISGG